MNLVSSGIDRVAGYFAVFATWIGDPEIQRVLAVFVAALGLWWLVPGGATGRVARSLAWIVAALGILGLILPGDSLRFHGTGVLIWTFSALAVGGAALMVTERRPFYSAIWFALVLLAVGGLFLLYGAQFLGVATVAVYAGAIVVTFLFVLMLAQPEGGAFYDRLSWGSLPRWLGCLAGMTLAAGILWASDDVTQVNRNVSADQAGLTATAPSPKTDADPDSDPGDFDPEETEHVAALGGQLFSRHWLAVQLAGVLLTAALVGVVSMAWQRPHSPQLAAQLRRAITGDEHPGGGSSHG